MSPLKRFKNFFNSPRMYRVYMSRHIYLYILRRWRCQGSWTTSFWITSLRALTKWLVLLQQVHWNYWILFWRKLEHCTSWKLINVSPKKTLKTSGMYLVCMCVWVCVCGSDESFRAYCRMKTFLNLFMTTLFVLDSYLSSVLI